MKKIFGLIILMSFILFLNVACGARINDSKKQDNTTEYDHSLWPDSFTLNELYKDIMDDIVKIELDNGTNGMSYTITNSETLDIFKNLLGNSKFIIMEDQSPKVGWIYSIKFTNSDGNWLSYVFGYSVKDNLRTDKNAFTPYYEVEDVESIIEQIKDIEKTLE